MIRYAIVLLERSYEIPADHVTLPIESTHATLEELAAAFAQIHSETAQAMLDAGGRALPQVIAIEDDERRLLNDAEEAELAEIRQRRRCEPS